MSFTVETAEVLTQPAVIIRHQEEGEGEVSLTVHLLGATVTSWIWGGKERLFVSDKAVFNGTKAIRGGIPLVFPQFGQPDASMPQHGVARTSIFTFEEACSGTSSDGTSFTACFRLCDSPVTRAVWDHSFVLLYMVTLGKDGTLETKMHVTNSGASPFTCQLLQHTYIRVEQINKVAVGGFNQRRYIDKVLDSAEGVDEREMAVIEGEVDRVYLSTQAGGGAGSLTDLSVINKESQEVIVKVHQHYCLQCTGGPEDKVEGDADVVLWNAWEEKSKALLDLGEGNYVYYVCVEPGVVSNGGIEVAPCMSIQLTQKLSLQ